MAKRYITGLLAMGLIALMLAACGDASDASETSESDDTPVTEDDQTGSGDAKNDRDTADDGTNTGSEETQDKSDADHEKTNDSKSADQASPAHDDSSNDEDSKADAKKDDQANANENGDDVTIASMEEAIDHLKKRLDERDEYNMEDTKFIPDDRSPKTNDRGTYYIISLQSKSLKEDGGSGTIGKYNVYQSGNYEMAY